MASKFIHLHTHSHYSLLDGLAKIDDLVEQASKFGMPALALTDHGNMYGAIEFYKKCKKAGIKPIIGVEAYVAIESMSQKRPNIDSKRYHIVLLAKNETGYKNLIHLVSASNLEGFYYKPRIDKEILREHSEGLIGLSACLAGELARKVGMNDFEGAEESAREYEEIFGKGNFFIEIMHHPSIENFQNIQNKLAELAKKTGIPLVATQDIHYAETEDAEAQDVLVAIQRKENLTGTDRKDFKKENFSFRSGEEMERYFQSFPGAIENTAKIAEKCSLELELGKWVFPKFTLPKGKNAEDFLVELAMEGYKKKFAGANEAKGEIKKRMDYELDIIIKKGYAPYFLVVADIINWARKQKIITTTRGSAAGSLISYLIDITNIDPMEYELPFERFLNPYRPSPPDIDMDFADDRRDEVIEYVKEKYGKDHVAQIGTFGTMMARAAVRDVTRALGKPYETGDKIAKLIPFGSQGFPMTIEQAIKITPELREMYKKETEIQEVIDLAKKIEGGARHISVHAAGVVISPSKLTDYVPLQREPNGEKIITQYDMHAVEDAGLLKFDFLGIKNLAILGNAVRLVKKIHNKEIDLENLPLGDKKTYDLLSNGETIGVFQLGGSGMIRWLKELKPSNINDIMAMIALFRPGPMANIPTYVKRKHGKETVTYPDPRLEKILGKTYGVVTYQEDVLLIAMELAGYNWETVDKFRKAIGKKIPSVMAKEEKTFIEGCQKHGGVTLKKAEELWKLFDPFKGYGFNKAHAASYAQIAYQTAYLKANYLAEFMTAVLTADAGDTEKIAASINECKRMKISVLPPDINESFGDFTVVSFPEVLSREPMGKTSGNSGNAIRFGLYSIKNLGTEIANAIIEERKNNGFFKTFSGFLERVRHKNLNKKSLEALVKSGAMDALGERNQMLFNMDEALNYNKETAKMGQSQTSLFGLMQDQSSVPDLKLKEAEPASQDEKLLWEKELLGLYISGHPLNKFKDKMAKIKTKIGKAKKLGNGLPVVTAGMIEEIRKVITKKNASMLFVKLSDYDNTI
ncbi:MAG TPA: DNA polymerase III subunit alpha, partial [bacterium]|nr:DNA polymerase III subunit alpha [bacterium]